ncbi:MAG: HAD family hydrolase [Candidatus Roizmanbacteria bacterium]
MDKAIVLDLDGVLIKGARFSDTLAERYNIQNHVTKEFFVTTFQDCLIGKKDLKKELSSVISSWGWRGNVNQFIDVWFSGENVIDEEMTSILQIVRNDKVPIFVATNNEKYRTGYVRMLLDETLIEYVYSSADIGYIKPHFEFYETVRKSIQKKYPTVQQFVFWDDDKHNVEGALNAGFHSYFFQSNEQFKKELQSHFDHLTL